MMPNALVLLSGVCVLAVPLIGFCVRSQGGKNR
jgi:hypothetical protein